MLSSHSKSRNFMVQGSLGPGNPQYMASVLGALHIFWYWTLCIYMRKQVAWFQECYKIRFEGSWLKLIQVLSSCVFFRGPHCSVHEQERQNCDECHSDCIPSSKCNALLHQALPESRVLHISMHSQMIASSIVKLFVIITSRALVQIKYSSYLLIHLISQLRLNKNSITSCLHT